MYFVLSFILQVALFLEKFTLLATKFTLPPAVTVLTNITIQISPNIMKKYIKALTRVLISNQVIPKRTHF